MLFHKIVLTLTQILVPKTLHVHLLQLLQNVLILTSLLKGCISLCNLNLKHLVPKIDELRIVMATEECPDSLALFETFLGPRVSDGQMALDGYIILRKNRAEALNKYRVGLTIYFRESLNVKRRPEIEISNLETTEAEITLPNVKPFLVCSVYVVYIADPILFQTVWISLMKNYVLHKLVVWKLY